MQTPELTNTQALIDRYYTEEKAKKEQALTRASLNIQLDANDLAMLNIIAKRFDKARDELAKDILSNALIDLLTQLEPGERKLIARDADEMGSSMAREIAEENGLKDIDHKPNVWTGHERNIARAEKKRAKELEEARKAAKKAQANADFSEEVAASTESSLQEVTQQQTAEVTEASTAEAPAQELDSQEQVQQITESTPAESAAEDTSEVA
jgi:chemotaxis protein histidine kinase CheA